MASFSKSAPRLSRCFTTTSPALGPGEAATKEAVNTDSNARFGGEVEGNVSGTAIFWERSVELDRLY